MQFKKRKQFYKTQCKLYLRNANEIMLNMRKRPLCHMRAKEGLLRPPTESMGWTDIALIRILRYTGWSGPSMSTRVS